MLLASKVSTTSGLGCTSAAGTSRCCPGIHARLSGTTKGSSPNETSTWRSPGIAVDGQPDRERGAECVAVGADVSEQQQTGGTV